MPFPKNERHLPLPNTPTSGEKFGAWCAAQLRVSIGLYAKTNNLVLLNPQLYDVLLILSQFPK